MTTGSPTACALAGRLPPVPRFTLHRWNIGSLWRLEIRRRRRIAMFYQDNRLQYPIRVETPNLVFGKALQQAIGGVEGEIRVAMQYMFQAWGARGGDPKFRDLLPRATSRPTCSRTRWRSRRAAFSPCGSGA
jgi:hypothetical protein